MSDNQAVSLDAELDQLFEGSTECGSQPPKLIQAIIADRKQLWQQRIAALQVDMHVARALKDEQQAQVLREQGKRALQAIQTLKEMEAGLPAK